jgi:hypothetical protein
LWLQLQLRLVEAESASANSRPNSIGMKVVGLLPLRMCHWVVKGGH